MSKYELTGLYISKDELQAYLDDIDSRLTALDTGGTGTPVNDRVTRLEEIHKYNHSIGGPSHDKGSNYQWANSNGTTGGKGRANKHYPDEEICKQLGII